VYGRDEYGKYIPLRAYVPSIQDDMAEALDEGMEGGFDVGEES
jgi:hypothetical protein